MVQMIMITPDTVLCDHSHGSDDNDRMGLGRLGDEPRCTSLTQVMVPMMY